MKLLPFAQLDLPGEVPIGAGRYLVRPLDEPDADPDVLAVNTLGAPRARSRLRRGRPVPVESEPDATPVPLSRVALIKSIPFESAEAGGRWLERVRGDDELSRNLATEVAIALNRAIEAHRVAAPEIYALPIHAGRAAAVRIGYGNGDELADGRWTEAIELAEKGRKSLRAELVDGVGAQERIAAVLGGRDSVAPAESLLVDAELAHAEGRYPLAAITLDAALGAAARAGADTEEAARALLPLAEAAHGHRQIAADELRKALRKARRAIRAAD